MIKEQGFRLLELANQNSVRLCDKPEVEAHFQASETKRPSVTHDSELIFETIDALVDFVTKRWRERWVTTDVWNGVILDRLLLRPFFLLVSVDAPVSLRWQRFRNR